MLAILKNYSGDRMNFSIAKELAEAEGISVESVVVKDDVAVPDSTYSTGRRGIAGTVLVHKIAGARRGRRSNLEKVKTSAQKARIQCKKYWNVYECMYPSGTGQTRIFTGGEIEIEIGMGIHGEPGIKKSGIKPADELAEVHVEQSWKTWITGPGNSTLDQRTGRDSADGTLCTGGRT